MQTYREWRALTDEQLIEQYDGMARNASAGLSFVREEIAHRDHERQTAAMVGLTRWIARMTAVLLALTIVNVVAVVLAL